MEVIRVLEDGVYHPCCNRSIGRFSQRLVVCLRVDNLSNVKLLV